MTTDAVQIETRELDGCVILDITAENFTYPHTSVVKAKVAEFLELGKRFIVLNVNNVQIVDSYGLATIVASLKLIKDRSGAMAMYGLNGMFVHLVELTQLDKILEVWPSEGQATYYLSTLMKESTPATK